MVKETSKAWPTLGVADPKHRYAGLLEKWIACHGGEVLGLSCGRDPPHACTAGPATATIASVLISSSTYRITQSERRVVVGSDKVSK